MSVFFQIKLEKAIRLDALLAKNVENFSRTKLKSLILSGNVSVNNVTVSDPAFSCLGDLSINVNIHTQYDEEDNLQKSYKEVNLPLNIVFEDDDLAVIDKPAGISVHYGAGNDDVTLVNVLRYHFKNNLANLNTEKPGIVHRLDKDTSGLLMIAKNDNTYDKLIKMFLNREIYKEYIAFVWNVPRGTFFTMNNLIGRSKNNRLKRAVVSENGKVAISKFFVKDRYSNIASKIQCIIETGRTHQIRVHLSHNKTPVIGDLLYGYKKTIPGYEDFFNDFSRNALHSSVIKFIHPITFKEIVLSSDLPLKLKELEVILKQYPRNS